MIKVPMSQVMKGSHFRATIKVTGLPTWRARLRVASWIVWVAGRVLWLAARVAGFEHYTVDVDTNYGRRP